MPFTNMQSNLLLILIFSKILKEKKHWRCTPQETDGSNKISSYFWRWGWWITNNVDSSFPSYKKVIKHQQNTGHDSCSFVISKITQNRIRLTPINRTIIYIAWRDTNIHHSKYSFPPLRAASLPFPASLFEESALLVGI